MAARTLASLSFMSPELQRQPQRWPTRGTHDRSRWAQKKGAGFRTGIDKAAPCPKLLAVDGVGGGIVLKERNDEGSNGPGAEGVLTQPWSVWGWGEGCLGAAGNHG